MTTTPPGWYPDGGSPQLRYWDGTSWTEHVHDAQLFEPVKPEKISIVALVLAVIPLIGIVGGAVTLVAGKQRKTGALMMVIGLSSIVALGALRSQGSA